MLRNSRMVRLHALDNPLVLRLHAAMGRLYTVVAQVLNLRDGLSQPARPLAADHARNEEGLGDNMAPAQRVLSTLQGGSATNCDTPASTGMIRASAQPSWEGTTDKSDRVPRCLILTLTALSAPSPPLPPPSSAPPPSTTPLSLEPIVALIPREAACGICPLISPVIP